jgi:hypothetical protein
MLYSQSIRAEVKSENPDMTTGEIVSCFVIIPSFFSFYHYVWSYFNVKLLKIGKGDRSTLQSLYSRGKSEMAG